jgi:nicotinate-nucleotide pyrophosphorylase (carboxylating)
MRQNQFIKRSEEIDRIIKQALKEDIGKGDITTRLTVPVNVKAEARIIAKEKGILAGSPIVIMIFNTLDPKIRINFKIREGARFNKGAVVAEIYGNARALLTGERIALNFLCRLSGIGTLTRKFVDRVSHTKAKILDTRKTIPNLRALEKYAVRIGGGINHRFGLYDMILIKDNHIEAAGGITNAIKLVQTGGKTELLIEVETKNLTEVKEAIRLKVPVIMLDNMNIKQIKQAVKLVKGKAKLEVSGNVNLKTVSKIAETGIDYISVGTLTHSAPIIDMSMKITDSNSSR